MQNHMLIHVHTHKYILPIQKLTNEHIYTLPQTKHKHIPMACTNTFLRTHSHMRATLNTKAHTVTQHTLTHIFALKCNSPAYASLQSSDRLQGQQQAEAKFIYIY